MNKLKIIMLRGLPASGKSTFAKQFIKDNEGWKRINKDDLRAMLDNSKWSKANEKFVVQVRNLLISEALSNNFSVIVDDTNLAPKHELNLSGLAIQSGVEFEVKDFTDIPIDQCIYNDLSRVHSVGEKVIRKMYNDFLKPARKTVAQVPGLPYTILCDIDGTLALFEDKNPYERDFINDTLNIPVKEIINLFKDRGYSIILVSGRKNKFLAETKKWLKNNKVSYDEIYMPRADTDNRKDIIIKTEIYESHIQDRYNVFFVLDDRLQVCRLWHQLGLPILRVGDPDADF